jgi:hypothetical protein
MIQYCSDETFNEAKEEENIKLALQSINKENFIGEFFFSFLVLEKRLNLNAVREYARRGCPTSLRGKLWSTMLDFELSNWVDILIKISFF